MTKQQFLYAFFSALKVNNLSYFVLGSYKSLPEDTNGSDIDVVLSTQDIRLYERILHNLLCEGELTLASYYTNFNTKFYRILSAGWGVQIDVFYRGLCYKGVPYFPVEEMKDFVFLHNEVIYALQEQKGFFIDFFKELIHNGKAKEKYIEAVVQEVHTDTLGCQSMIERIYNKTIAETIIQNATIEGLTYQSRFLQKELRSCVVTWRQFLRVIDNSVQNILRLFQKTPGYVIAVEGTDGSGKSFIINSITPILNEAFHNGIVYNHLRPHVLPDIAEVLGKRKKQTDGSTKVVTEPHAQKQSGFAGSLVRWSYYMIDYTFGYLRKVWLQIHSKSKVFIFDRYYYEYYLDQRRSRVNLPMWIVRLGEFFIPKPDLILCLGGDPEKIYARKPETSLEEVTRQTKVLKEFCSKRKNAVWIDTTVAPEESINAAMKAINEMMSKRFDINDLK